MGKVGVFVTIRTPNARSRVAGEYSNEQSLLKVVVCFMMNFNEDWITGKRYLSLDDDSNQDTRPL
jgi:hypothetical protein